MDGHDQSGTEIDEAPTATPVYRLKTAPRPSFGTAWPWPSTSTTWSRRCAWPTS